MLGEDMGFKIKSGLISGLIDVSTEQLEWLLEREESFKKRWPNEPEVDPESMFVHEIAEQIIWKRPEVMINYFAQSQKGAREIENINRKERGLKPWPYH
jgi:hypothetical protein